MSALRPAAVSPEPNTIRVMGCISAIARMHSSSTDRPLFWSVTSAEAKHNTNSSGSIRNDRRAEPRSIGAYSSVSTARGIVCIDFAVRINADRLACAVVHSLFPTTCRLSRE